MEAIQKYWWVILAGVVILFLVSKKGSGAGPTVQAIGGQDTTALAQIAAQERAADEQNRVGVIATLLSYVQGRDAQAAAERVNTANNATNVQLATINANAQGNTANLLYAAQNAQAQAALQAQLAAIRAQNSQNSRNSWLNGILGGLNVFTPLLGNVFGSGGGFNIGVGGGGTPGFNPNSGGGWGFGF